jgi:iron-sulfur cluster repair protein YtfE (RIC family)
VLNNDESESLIHILLIKLENEINKLIKNDLLILFPKLKYSKDFGLTISLKSFEKSHLLIFDILRKIRELLNNYSHKPLWNIYTKLVCIECVYLE